MQFFSPYLLPLVFLKKTFINKTLIFNLRYHNNKLEQKVYKQIVHEKKSNVSNNSLTFKKQQFYTHSFLQIYILEEFKAV